MTHIDSSYFGSITIDGKKFHQVLIVNDQVVERDALTLNKKFNTTHLIGDWEVKLLLKDKPETIIVGKGQSGVLKVTNEIKQNILKEGIDLKILLTPNAVKEYNKLRASGKKVNALIHTTC